MSSGNGVGVTIASAQYAKAISIKNPSSHGWMPNAIPYKVTQHKEKKMGWFKRKFAQWSREAWEDGRNDELVPRRAEEVEAKSGVRFTVYPANGGYVIQHYKYDRFCDNEGPTLTIVPNGESIGQAVEHAIALEALKA